MLIGVFRVNWDLFVMVDYVQEKFPLGNFLLYIKTDLASGSFGGAALNSYFATVLCHNLANKKRISKFQSIFNFYLNFSSILN